MELNLLHLYLVYILLLWRFFEQSLSRSFPRILRETHRKGEENDSICRFPPLFFSLFVFLLDTPPCSLDTLRVLAGNGEHPFLPR